MLPDHPDPQLLTIPLGPEFEAVSFTSNRTLATVIQRMFSGAAVPLATPRRRPDFVIVPNGSLGVYSADAFDARHEVSGLSRVVVVELKRGGFKIDHAEKTQALDYARELRKAGRVAKETPILCYVLGATIDPSADDEVEEGRSRVLPRRYDAVLKQAHARTFRLLQKIQTSKAVLVQDPDLADVLDQEELAFTSESPMPPGTASDEKTPSSGSELNQTTPDSAHDSAAIGAMTLSRST